MLSICVVTDWRKRKIYNLVTTPGFILGIIYVIYVKTYSASYCVSLFFLFLILLLVYSHGAMRGGDVKLLLALSLFLTPGAFFFNLALFMFSAFFYFFFQTVRVKGLSQTVNDVKTDSLVFIAIGENNNSFANGVKSTFFPGGGAALISLCYIVTSLLFNIKLFL
ncbi:MULTISPECIES: A24 family peptidase [unclassified Dehalobacter]|uniref:A24 family peptidase n=1 Tax=unclassified Dehalobacter TaxID=2635733 RepID=UPI0009DB08E2|nr:MULTISPECIES: A24 family peptidase [unclassified Dehalobacter]